MDQQQMQSMYSSVATEREGVWAPSVQVHQLLNGILRLWATEGGGGGYILVSRVCEGIYDVRIRLQIAQS